MASQPRTLTPGDCVTLRRRIARVATPIPHEPGWRLSGAGFASACAHNPGALAWVVCTYPRSDPDHPLASDAFVMTPAWIIRMVDGTHKWVIADDVDLVT